MSNGRQDDDKSATDPSLAESIKNLLALYLPTELRKSLPPLLRYASRRTGFIIGAIATIVLLGVPAVWIWIGAFEREITALERESAALVAQIGEAEAGLRAAEAGFEARLATSDGQTEAAIADLRSAKAACDARIATLEGQVDVAVRKSASAEESFRLIRKGIQLELDDWRRDVQLEVKSASQQIAYILTQIKVSPGEEKKLEQAKAETVELINAARRWMTSEVEVRE